jgi:hypothetical protein
VEEYPAGQLTVKGAPFDIWVTDDGEWVAKPNSIRVTAATRAGLADEIARVFRPGKVAVRFIMLEGTGNAMRAVRGTATGIHSGNGALLVTWEGGRRGQLSTLTPGSTMLDPGTDPEEWARLFRASVEAGQALYRFVQAHKIDVRQEVRAALRATAEESEDETS